MGRRILAVAVPVIVVCSWGRSQAQETQQSEAEESTPVLEDLGAYETKATKRALQELNLIVDGNPQGKVLGAIHVVNLDVFAASDGPFHILNALHITTQEHVIEREVLLRPGDLWDDALVNETERALKDPLFTSLVVLVPVVSPQPGFVDLLVVTRDVWSLRTNSSFQYTEGILTDFSLSLAENNIWGLRKHGALAFVLTQGNYSLGPQYIDRALGGTHLRLTTYARAIFGRADNEFEGSLGEVSLQYPLWSLQRKWAALLRVGHSTSTIRSFRGVGLRTYDNPDTAEMEEVPWEYRFRSLLVEGNATRSFGDGIKQHVTLGYQLKVDRPDFVQDFVADETIRAAFRRDVFPRSELSSSLSLRYRVFTPKFSVYRNLDSYDLAEDFKIGPDVSVGMALALTALGADRNFATGDISLSWVLPVTEDGFVRAGTGVSTRIEGEDWIDNTFSNVIAVAAPRFVKAFRLVAQARLDMRLRETANRFYTIGGGAGLRGYGIGEFTGQRRFVTNVEVRFAPIPIWFARVGGVAFWDVGHASERFNELRPKHGLGVGLRYLMPQLQPFVFRFDWAFPLNATGSVLPGRLTAGVAQAF